jgi:RecB family exonuclease/inactivated superfamily I helicase
VRTAGLRAFREAVADLARAGAPLDARDRLVVVPTRAAASQLVRTIEARRVGAAGADVVLLPDLITPRELVGVFGARLPFDRPTLTGAEREVLLGAACRAARDAGAEPPFRLRPALVAEMLRFYDTLRANGKDVDTLERLALGRLEPGAEIDRGAQRLVRQTRFLAAAFREFERRSVAAGADEHELRARVLVEPARRPVRHAIVAVGDQAFDPHGLCSADWDLLARVPGLEQLDVVVTDTDLPGAPHERMHALLPGIEEVRAAAAAGPDPTLLVPSGGAKAYRSRDREEDVAGYARRVKRAVRNGELSPERAAFVVCQPLPYVYVAREVFRSAGIPCQMFDTLPLAAEPFAAALDLVLTAVDTSFARASVVALLRCPHFDLAPGRARADAPAAEDVAALDRALSEAGYLGEIEPLERLLDRWHAESSPRTQLARALRAGDVLRPVVRELAPLRVPAPTADHLDTLAGFLGRHNRPSGPDDPLGARDRRARAAIVGTLRALRDAYARFDEAPAEFSDVARLVRRWIEGHTFAPRTGNAGVHLVDAASARFGDFDLVQLAGLVDGEWPEPPRRNIFYSAEIVRDLGWPSESGRREAARARFIDLLRLPSTHIVVSTFALEADAPVSPSPLLDELGAAGLNEEEEDLPATRIFEYEALATDPQDLEALAPVARRSLEVRRGVDGDDPRFHGQTSPHAAAAWSLSALERYQDCPFAFFAANVLRLDEEPDDGSTLSPQARGRFMHDVLHRFFDAWDGRGGGPITPARVADARALFAEVAAPLLDGLSSADASLERARLFGSAVSPGVVDTLLGVEASRPDPVRERWLEHRLQGDFTLGLDDGRRIALRGVADRIDLLPERRLRVIDYKTGATPNPRRALQVPIYALCAAERLETRDGAPWIVEEAAYLGLAGPRPVVPVVKPGDADRQEVLLAARSRLIAAVDGIERGAFPPRPHDPMICRSCAFSTVCRKDYVADA